MILIRVPFGTYHTVPKASVVFQDAILMMEASWSTTELRKTHSSESSRNTKLTGPLQGPDWFERDPHSRDLYGTTRGPWTVATA